MVKGAHTFRAHLSGAKLTNFSGAKRVQTALLVIRI